MQDRKRHVGNTKGDIMEFDFSIIGVLSWVHLSAKSQLVVAQNASNLLLCLYVISYILTKRAAILAVFLLVEVYGNLSLVGGLTDAQYYVGYAVLYCFGYWVVFYGKYQLSTLYGYGTMILFQLWMTLDAIFNPAVEAFVYTHYIYFVVFVHIYIMLTLCKWSLIGRSMGVIARDWSCIGGINDTRAFIQYNIGKKAT